MRLEYIQIPDMGHFIVGVKVSNDMIDWLNENNLTWKSRGSRYIEFKTKDEAMLFKLTWG